jgi:isopenicillin N synthase-like dioxygenase
MKNYIPTINISTLLKSDFNTLASKNTLRKIEKACVEIGFFQVTGTWDRYKKNK